MVLGWVDAPCCVRRAGFATGYLSQESGQAEEGQPVDHLPRFDDASALHAVDEDGTGRELLSRRFEASRSRNLLHFMDAR
jgi:hypothetical protein